MKLLYVSASASLAGTHATFGRVVQYVYPKYLS